MKIPQKKLLILVVSIILIPVLSAEDIHQAAKTGDIEAIKMIVNIDRKEINSLDEYKYTPLDWAATLAQWDTVRYLLDEGADTQNIGWDGGTVLHRACHYDNAEIVDLLIDKDADCKVKNQWGRTALHVTARRNCFDVTKLLINKGADPNATTKEGWSPLHVAAKSGHLDMMKLLESLGSSKDLKDKDGKIPEDLVFKRPAQIQLDPGKYAEYVGQYSTETGFIAVIWVKNGRIYVTDFGYDELYPVGPDEFFCKHEPWRIKFYRNKEGGIIEMDLSFLRQTHRMKKITTPY